MTPGSITISLVHTNFTTKYLQTNVAMNVICDKCYWCHFNKIIYDRVFESVIVICETRFFIFYFF